MDHPTLYKGNKGSDVVLLQTYLNKAGAMLVPDGDFGLGTQRGVRYAQHVARQPVTGVADSELWKWLEPLPEPFPQLATNGVAFIACEETGGLAYYDMTTRWPHFPGHESGITIGVGYDLRFNSRDDLKKVWGNHLLKSHIDELANDIGRKGSTARAQELKRLGVEVPFEAAWQVLIGVTLPKFHSTTESIYPSLRRLPDLCRSVLVSIVYNRGASLTGPRRREMKEIQDLLAQADDAALTKPEAADILDGVEEQILSMKRLWAPGSGLVKRRQAEANLWRKGLGNWRTA